MWKEMPPLAALRAFEATARCGSFSAAARELNVTHPAVVQQVRQLEAHLGLPLARREGRHIALTDDGAALARSLSDGFGTIAAGLAALRSAAGQRPLQVTLTPSFATDWLMPRLGRFWSAHPDLPIALHPTRRHMDLAREGIDLAIRFGTGDWPGVVAERLVPARFAVVGAPSLLGDRVALTPEQMATLPWVIEQDWPEQLVWLRRQGIDPDKLRATFVQTEELARAAVRQGYGLHVEATAIIAGDIATGRLRAVFTGSEDSLGYWLVTRPGHDTPALRTFLRWLRSVA